MEKLSDSPRLPLTMRDGRVYDVEGLLDKIRDIKTADGKDDS